jgi:hypothetical protein
VTLRSIATDRLAQMDTTKWMSRPPLATRARCDATGLGAGSDHGRRGARPPSARRCAGSREKGFVGHTVEGRTYVYQATEARGRVAARAVQRIVDWFCNESAEDMLVRMVDAAMLDRRRLRMLTERVSQTKSGRMMR